MRTPKDLLVPVPAKGSEELTRGRGFNNKIQTRHLARLAVVYVRQSSARQVQENVESTQLQYGLVDRANALGWSACQVVVIDDDLGISAKTLEGRLGFQRLLAELGLGHVGIVLGIEMSRLARSCRDWHHLLELCAMCGALLADADGIYDPRDHNDRLLLGLKGTMSEAELHLLRNRLEAGRRNKARRGEYFAQVPIGYVRAGEGISLEPDEQARRVVHLVFDKFAELGSIHAVLRFLRHEKIRLGIRAAHGPDRGMLMWRRPHRGTLLGMLHHPNYAGAYVYGRRKTDASPTASGTSRVRRRFVPQDEWEVLILDRVPAYIGWEQWERNQEKLRENSTTFGVGAPRGVSLLAGRVVCGRCGARMVISYAGKGNARFTCDADRMEFGDPQCQSLSAHRLDSLVVNQVLRALEPTSLDLSLQAGERIEAERKRVEDQHRQSVERAAYEANLARRRYDAVDPDNRLVAAELERRWESAIHEQQKAEQELHRQCGEQPPQLTEEERGLIRALAHDIPTLWRSDSTLNADRQIVIRTLIDDVTVEVLGVSERVAVTIHWVGGFESRHELRRRVVRFENLESSDEIARRIQELWDAGHSLSDMANELNKDGHRPARGERFTKTLLGVLCRKLRRQGSISKDRPTRPNYWRAGQLAKRLGLKNSTLSGWRRREWVQVAPVGRRWLYWADPCEIRRLEKLAAIGREGFHSAPRDLTTPASTIDKS